MTLHYYIDSTVPVYNQNKAMNMECYSISQKSSSSHDPMAFVYEFCFIMKAYELLYCGLYNHSG